MRKETGHQLISKVAIPLKKGRGIALQSSPLFTASERSISVNDRRKARSIKGVSLLAKDSETHSSTYETENFAWHLLRMIPTNLLEIEHDDITEDYDMPSWNKFFDNLYESSEKNVIAYGPIFPDSPTKPNVVEKSLDYFMTVMSKLGQNKTVVTCDQAIYDIAKGLAKKYSEKYANLVIRLGGFHIAENFMGAIGYFMKESGMEDILVESKVCGRGTANKVMSAKDYYQMLRCHTLVSEAMIRLKWLAFEKWLLVEGSEECLTELADTLDNIFSKLHESNLVICSSDVNLIKISLTLLRDKLDEFEESLVPTARFWSMYIDMTQILRRYIQAERSGNWDNHLIEVQNMIPYMVSAGHRNYAVCLPLYLTDMRGLAESAPDVHTEFINGNFCVHRTTGTFNGIWVDLAHEQTYNRDGKTSLSKGTSQNPAAREKYLKTAPFLNAVSQQIEDMLHTPGSVSSHHRESLNSSIVTEAKVNDIIYIVTNRMTDPYIDLQHNEVINIANGIIASSQDILMAKERGIAAMEEAEANGFDKIKVTKVVTFATQKQMNKHKNKPTTKVYQYESMVTRALYFAQGANDESKLDAFSHEWAQYPTSLFEPDNRSPQGYSMRKGTKSDYLAALCSLNSGHDAILKDSLAPSQLQTVYVIDAMAFIQRFQTLGAKTFQQVSELYLQNNLHLKPTGCSVVHFVGDRYDIPDDVSLKCDERLRRNQSKFSPEYIPVDNIEIPDWNALLRNPLNKGHILHYFSSSWCQNNRLLAEELHLFLGGTFNDRSRANVVTRGQ